jgi:hypothetical protein
MCCPCALQLYSALSSRAGRRGKVCGCQIAFASDDPTERFKMDNIELLALFTSAVAHDHGMARLIAGVDDKGKKHEYDTYSDDLKKLAEGVEMWIPDDERGSGLRKVTVFFWQLCMSCDFPAAATLLPYTSSTQSHRCCRQCPWDVRHRDARRPHSFYHANSTLSKRSAKRLRAALDRYLEAPDADAELRELDVVRAVFFADRKYVPGSVPTEDAPQDILHLFGDGLLNIDFAFLRVILKSKYNLTADRINAAVRAYKQWPNDVRIPPFVDMAKNGAYGIPKSDATCRITGSEMATFALHRFAHAPPHTHSPRPPPPTALTSSNPS